jgi:hypothetical protein
LALSGISSEAKKLLVISVWNDEAEASGAEPLIDAIGLMTERDPEAQFIITAKARLQGYALAAVIGCLVLYAPNALPCSP